MLKDLFVALWFFVPAGVANVSPIFAAKLPILKHFSAPIDGGLILRHKRILGDHKTWRGLIVGIIAATLILWVQQLLAVHIPWLDAITRQVNYAQVPILVLGPLFAIGALGGDAIESFFKRQRDIQPGHAWFPFDQTDYIVGGILATVLVVPLSIWQYLLVIVAWLIIHLISSYIGWLTGLKDKPI